ncbi:energy transducer TonB [Mucilaginibacter galii]|uniref:Biopolymer transporter TonB n=1 Tax=Mucilaginibacter galii TaxID=2005073 RepID=A0A917J9B1_9SPHI|nr:energy transducer TonB [Mucilaginibacter galii]GGI50312.1 biopolymer transporter TonB [Mucilaginibacter galii]
MLNSKFDLYKSEWLDLVFADRNKSYGAYDLRNHYGDNMMKALAITVLGFTVAAISFTIAFKHDVVPDYIERKQEVHIAPPIFEKPKVEEPVKAKLREQPIKSDAPKTPVAPQVNMNTQRVLPPKITTEPVTTELPVIDMSKQISNVNNTVDPTKPTTGILDGTNTLGNKGTPAGTPTGNSDGNIIFDGGLDIMPEPFGGSAAWSKFIQRTLRYPETDMEGRVTISFIVEKDGHLSDIQVVKGVSADLDREALRVIKLAPAWKPGKQNGQPVRVRYTIPIVFQMNQ